MCKKQRQKTNECDCSNNAKFDTEKSIQLKNIFSKNVYATTNECIKFNGTQTHNHLVLKRTLKHLAKVA